MVHMIQTTANNKLLSYYISIYTSLYNQASIFNPVTPTNILNIFFFTVAIDHPLKII